jgi:hypothetical protein
MNDGGCCMLNASISSHTRSTCESFSTPTNCFSPSGFYSIHSNLLLLGFSVLQHSAVMVAGHGATFRGNSGLYGGVIAAQVSSSNACTAAVSEGYLRTLSPPNTRTAVQLYTALLKLNSRTNGW